MRFQEGALGSLVFTSLLHGAAFQTTFDILADGLHIHIEDPYDKPSVTARTPGSNTYEAVSCLQFISACLIATAD